MALRPGSGGGGGGSNDGSSFRFPVSGGLVPPQGMMSMQQQQPQQGFPMVPVMQPNMQGMMDMNFGSQMPPGAMPMQGGMAMGPMPPAGMSFMPQHHFIRLRPSPPRYTKDMQRKFSEEQQKQMQKQLTMLGEQRKRRQFEEQKQRLRLLSSVKPKMGEKNRDDALEAIKGNLAGFTRDAKMHPGPTSHPSKLDTPQSSLSAAPPSQSPAFPDDEEFSDFIQGPESAAPAAPTSFQPFQPFHPTLEPGLQSELAAAPAQPVASAHPSAASSLYATAGHSAKNSQGPSLEEKMFASCDLSMPKQAHIKFNQSRPLANIGPKASVSTQFQPSAKACNWAVQTANLGGVFTADMPKDPEPETPAKESGVAVYPTQETLQPMLPPWLFNDSLVPELYKKVLEATLTPAGIDTAKLYPILLSSGLPREMLGQIWAFANQATPGKLTKEELYTVLAMIAMSQRGIPVLNLENLNQFPSAPIPNLSGTPLTLPTSLPQQPMISVPTGTNVSSSVHTGQSVVGMNLPVPVGGSTTQGSSGFVASFPGSQAAKPDDDDFQDFQEAPKPNTTDDTFKGFKNETSGSLSKTSSSHATISAHTLLTPISGTSASSVDKYAVFKDLTEDKPPESSSFADFGDKYSVFRELGQSAENKPSGEGFAEFKSPGNDDGFTDFKTADSISPVDSSEKAKTFTTAFPSVPFLQPQLQPVTQPKDSFNLTDLFTSVSCTGENKTVSFPPVSVTSSIKSSVCVASSLSSLSSGTFSSASSKTAGGTDDFGDFNLFGVAASTSSGGGWGQDEFADFIAFGSSSTAGPTEQKSNNKYSVFRQEKNDGLTASFDASLGIAEGGQQPSTTTVDKYDVFKQLPEEGFVMGFEEQKDNSSLSQEKNEDDFPVTKLSLAFSSSDKSFVDKLSAFKQAKEDSASVKSLDLPSIGGSSIGKEDSEDALSGQFDMKSAEVGGDLKHVLSDSSLDLPPVIGQPPPVSDLDDFKFDPFGNFSNGSAVSSLTSYDWSEKEDCGAQTKKQPPFFLNSEGRSLSSASVLQKKETSFGSSENITMTTVSTVTTFSAEDPSSQCNFDAFGDLKETAERTKEKKGGGDLGDFAITSSGEGQLAKPNESSLDDAEQRTAVSVTDGVSSEGTKTEAFDEFGEFQSEKPKISKFDFLMASSQGKVKSSEEMIKSEMETFDLSVQGSHKRSLSLGDKEVTHAPPASEQSFRDRSNTLNEKPAPLPVIRDKYKDLTGEVEENERYAYEWQRCLESALQVIQKASDTLNGISSSTVCSEVIQSTQGMEYLLGVIEVYRVTKRVELGIKATAVCNEKLQLLMREIEKIWSSLMIFMSLTPLTPDENSLDFSSCILRPGIKNAKELACGVCLLNVDSRSKEDENLEDHPKQAFNSESDNFKLSYGGHQYHASCANFWINCVEPKPPGLILPDLL
ncbi:synergin gamma isoform X1 [Scyliorhinus canicula]|uniref:synergin gamma isoform X1 n=2 Tax=Scyliorhinus canicula TaxID=7830 RepID=UPI0018F6B8EF|nr:synergin gamma isoform X1 [Scyliorhinus canicula]